MKIQIKKRSVLPGFGLTLGYTVFYLSLIVLIPLAGLFFKTSTLTWEQFWLHVTQPRALASYRLTIGASFIGACINAFFGFIVAWTLVRYSFPGKRFVDALVDLPFALPTAVAGIALTAIYAPNGWMGQWLEKVGIHAAFSPLGVTIALTFIGLPFVVRTLQPALQDLNVENEEAAASLGATPFYTFRRVILPTVMPSLLTGFTMAFARALGEYGSVVFISGGRAEITAQLIIIKLEQYDYAGATSIAVVMLIFSFILLLLINGIQWWSSQRYREA